MVLFLTRFVHTVLLTRFCSMLHASFLYRFFSLFKPWWLPEAPRTGQSVLRIDEVCCYTEAHRGVLLHAR